MELKEIVCDFEYAEKLKELGVYKNGLFWFCNDKRNITRNGASEWAYLSTYTVAELGEMLPYRKTINNQTEYDLIVEKDSDRYLVSYTEIIVNEMCMVLQSCEDQKEANARAKLLIWLIENNHVKVEELNK